MVALCVTKRLALTDMHTQACESKSTIPHYFLLRLCQGNGFLALTRQIIPPDTNY